MKRRKSNSVLTFMVVLPMVNDQKTTRAPACSVAKKRQIHTKFIERFVIGHSLERIDFSGPAPGRYFTIAAQSFALCFHVAIAFTWACLRAPTLNHSSQAGLAPQAASK